MSDYNRRPRIPFPLDLGDNDEPFSNVGRSIPEKLSGGHVVIDFGESENTYEQLANIIEESLQNDTEQIFKILGGNSHPIYMIINDYSRGSLDKRFRIPRKLTLVGPYLSNLHEESVTEPNQFVYIDMETDIALELLREQKIGLNINRNVRPELFLPNIILLPNSSLALTVNSIHNKLAEEEHSIMQRYLSGQVQISEGFPKYRSSLSGGQFVSMKEFS